MTAEDPVAREMRTANLQREAQRLRVASEFAENDRYAAALKAQAREVEAQVRRRLGLAPMQAGL